MTKGGFRLGAVLRARKAQEDMAKAAVVRARADATAAAQRVLARGRDLDGRGVPGTASSTAYAATLTARQALAGELAAAIGASRLADDGVNERMGELTDAAVQRRTIEKLQERHDATRKRTEAAAEAKAVDDITTATSYREDIGSYQGSYRKERP
ncbi:cell envelope biogenesis protein TolA [Dactylosporangium sp. NPDC000555]|uniref:cell envelope biogenesis protein TolA n=1 Tax=Dactylosporangium sp. NPDC000555 TaxID=3154260 RepID=UPI003316EA98